MNQTMKLSETGSLNNWIYGNNATKPEVEKDATIMYWTDREAYKVIEVSEDGKRAVLQRYDAKRIDNNGMSDDQHYEYKDLKDEKKELHYKWGAWRIHYKETKRWEKVNVVFGYAREYYDYSF